MVKRTDLTHLYTSYTGSAPTSIEELPSSGSNRRYFRLTGSADLIGVIGTCLEENEAFLYFDKHFGGKGINVPEVVAVSEDRMS